MQTHGTRLFGMELDGVYVVIFKNRRVGMQVGTGRGGRFVYGRIVAVREVSKSSVFEPRKELGWPGFFKRVPAHVRDARVAREAPHTAGEKTQAAACRRFFATFKQTLQADADAEKRHARRNSFE